MSEKPEQEFTPPEENSGARYVSSMTSDFSAGAAGGAPTSFTGSVYSKKDYVERVSALLEDTASYEAAARSSRARELQAKFVFGDSYIPPEDDLEVAELDEPQAQGLDAFDDGKIYGTPLELFRYRTLVYRERARRMAIERRVLVRDLLPAGLIENKMIEVWREMQVDLSRLPVIFKQRFPGLEEYVYEFIQEMVHRITTASEERLLRAPLELRAIS